MPFKTSIAASAVAALALAQTTLAAPVSSEASEPQCVSLGKGAFGFNSSAIGAATDDPPAIYLTVDTNEQNRIVASDKPVYEVQALFEFFNCSSVTTPAADGSGTVQTYQGYIKAPNGQCVTLSPDQVGSILRWAYVDAYQHFQFQRGGEYTYHSAVFLGETPGPVDATQFGAGGNYHFYMVDSETKDFLAFRDSRTQPQTGDKSEMLIGQLGQTYKVPIKTFPECKLVNTKTGETQKVTSNVAAQFPYGNSPLIHGTGESNLEFYQCDSTYMGYQQDASNFYGHFASDSSNPKDCFIHALGGEENNMIIEVFPQDSAGKSCGTDDTYVQVPSFFHLTRTHDGFEINYLGATKSEGKAEYGWLPTPVVNSNETDPVAIYVSPSATDYKLRFTA